MATTLDNLKEAFAGESQAFQKYTAFAKKAEQDGFPAIARLFLGVGRPRREEPDREDADRDEPPESR